MRNRKELLCWLTTHLVLIQVPEQLKSTADNKRKNGKALEGKIIFAYSKIISKYARKNAMCTAWYKILAKMYE